MFVLQSTFKPTGDQPQAINKLCEGIQNGVKNQVLLGVTGSGKTFTIANVIKRLQMPTLVISHNKTLAGQIYQEMRDFFPTNAVSYFVSYYDYYQPEAYIPQTDTYIEKEAQINELIDKLRLKSTANILTRKDVIVVASVSCIYNIGSPREYGKSVLLLKRDQNTTIKDIVGRLVQLQYERSEFDFKRGTFRVRGSYIDVYPAYEDFGYRIMLENDKVTFIYQFEPLSGKFLDSNSLSGLMLYPAKHFVPEAEIMQKAKKEIKEDLKKEFAALKKNGHIPEAERLLRRVNYDLEMIDEIGYVNGIENYSRYFDGRKKGDPPFSLLDYFRETYGNNFLVCIDESHMSVPQIRGMFNGDFARKKMLVDFGFRLKAAFDNRPLRFEEFYKIPPHIIYTSATPDEWELNEANNEKKDRITTEAGMINRSTNIVEQLIRPTGIIDPKITVRPAVNEVIDLVQEIEKRVVKKQKILVTTLTKKVAEDLSVYLKEKNIKAEYLHSDIKTLERSNILDNLRKGNFDVLIGVNLLREGLDLPEVYLVAILDADKEGFLRSKTALIQTMGRAARNIYGEVIMYADTVTKSMKNAIDEIDRRREYQKKYNEKNNINPITIFKPIREKIINQDIEIDIVKDVSEAYFESDVDKLNLDSLTPYDTKKVIKKLERDMKRFAEEMNFELAIKIRDKIKEIKKL